MKKLLVALAAVLVTAATYGQGTVNFDNIGVNAPIWAPGGTRTIGAGTLPNAAAGLYVDSGGGNYTLVPGSTTTFFANSGAGAGYLNALTVTVPNVVAGQPGTFEVRAWSGTAGYDAATIRGSSTPITITTGGAGSPPGLPADLTGLQAFTLVPEPSTIAFGVIGGLALLLRRRK